MGRHHKHRAMILSAMNGCDGNVEKLKLELRLHMEKSDKAKLVRCNGRNKWLLLRTIDSHDEWKKTSIVVEGVEDVTMALSQANGSCQDLDFRHIECNDLNLKMDITWDNGDDVDLLCEHVTPGSQLAKLNLTDYKIESVLDRQCQYGLKEDISHLAYGTIAPDDSDFYHVFIMVVLVGVEKMLENIVNKMAIDEKIAFLSRRTKHCTTLVHELIGTEKDTGRFGRKILLLFDGLGLDEKYSILSISDNSVGNVLHYGMKQKATDNIKCILHHLEGSQLLQLLKEQAPADQATVLIYVVHQNDTESLDAILKSIHHSSDRLELLMIQGEDGNTALHYAVKELALVKCILQSLENHDEKISLLNVRNIEGQTAAEKATQSVRTYIEDVVRCRRELVTVCDEPCKVGKPREENNELASYYDSGEFCFPRGVNEILFRRYVAADRIEQQRIYQVYRIPTAELRAKMYSEQERLATFETGFKSNYMTATSLARAGLTNLKKDRDDVACVWCLVQFCNFEATVDPVALHFSFSAKVCEFIKHFSRKNMPLGGKQPNELANSFLDLSTYPQEASGCGLLRLDSGLDSLTVTQNPTVSAAASVLTFAAAGNGNDEAQQGSAQETTTVEQYIVFEKRTESIMTPSSIRAVMINDPHTMRYEQMRFTSFVRKGWANFYAEHLAMAGFYLAEETIDTFTIACPFCDGKIQNVTKDTIPMFTKEKDHSPLQVHILKFPACAFIQGNNLGTRSNVPMIAGEFRWNESKVVTSAQANVGSELVTMGVATTQADCPPMAVYERRFESFLSLPYDHPKGAEELATCGFYNLGSEGKVKCFWCSVECGSWSSGEDVWVRHARSMRSCQFVINEKGAEFVIQVIEEHGEWIDSQRDEDRIRNVTTRMIRPRMDAPVVQTVISMGYTRDHVKTAIINRLKKLKPDYTSIADLVSDVLALRNKDMTYHRVLKLPDVPVIPKPVLEDQDEETHESTEDSASLADNVMQVEADNRMAEAADDLTSQQPEAAEESNEPPTKSVLDLSEEERTTVTRQMMSQLTCKICISSAVGIIFLPCAHLVCCTACAAAMTQCPMCRRDIAGTIKANV